MSVWYAVPSARPLADVKRCCDAWLDMGYRVMLQRDPGHSVESLQYVSVVQRPYLGYSEAVNFLSRHVVGTDKWADWIVTGGDDTYPDQTKPAGGIGNECWEHFNGTFGVMQPTGDPWEGSNISAICGSPWMGREFCRRMNGGAGPMWPEYFHMFNDEELQLVALKLGVLWQRPDLTHRHEHWARRGNETVAEGMPAFLERANSRENWDKMKALFEQRKAAGFPGHEPIP
jgi:hypothetical protein